MLGPGGLKRGLDTGGTAASANPESTVLYRRTPSIVLTAAGFDPSSGAGITADLQTFAAHGLFGTSAITALTVQSTRGVFDVQPVDAGLFRRTIERLWEDLPPRGMKLGMLGSPEIVRVAATLLRELGPEKPLVVLDPVLRSSSGHKLFPAEAVALLHEQLLPLMDWVTPNWGELALLSGEQVTDLVSSEHAMAALGKQHPHLTIVATGGEAQAPVDLLRLPDGSLQAFEGTHVETTATHGTGCAFSSALLSLLIQGVGPAEAVAGAKSFVEGALRQSPGLGAGRGPMDLLWPLRP